MKPKHLILLILLVCIINCWPAIALEDDKLKAQLRLCQSVCLSSRDKLEADLQPLFAYEWGRREFIRNGTRTPHPGSIYDIPNVHGNSREPG